MGFRRANPVSVTNRLLVSLIVIVLLVGAGSTLQLYLGSRRDIGEVLDAQLPDAAQLAISLLARETSLSAPGESPVVLPPPMIHTLRLEYHHTLVFQIVSDDRVLARSALAPDHPFTPRRQGFDLTTIDGRRWRVYALSDAASELTVQVARSEREQGVAQNSFASGVARVVPLYLIGMVLLIWFYVRRGLLPLQRLQEAVTERKAGDLTPIDKASVPREVDSVVDALNRTFSKLDAALARERNVISQAAHEMRTPLAVLHAQTERLTAARGRDQQLEAARQIVGGIRGTQRLIDQLLAMAALDTKASRVEFALLDLHELCQETLADMAPAAIAKDIELELTGLSEAVIVSGDHPSLTLLVRNLVDNAIKYTPEGGVVTVELRAKGEILTLAVSDTGPGIAPEHRDRIFQPFHRGAGSSNSGSGLGMAIARRVVDLHRGTIEFTGPGADGYGARFVVTLERAI